MENVEVWISYFFDQKATSKIKTLFYLKPAKNLKKVGKQPKLNNTGRFSLNSCVHSIA
jgi:hypothetical protein